MNVLKIPLCVYGVKEGKRKKGGMGGANGTLAVLDFFRELSFFPPLLIAGTVVLVESDRESIALKVYGAESSDSTSAVVNWPPLSRL